MTKIVSESENVVQMKDMPIPSVGIIVGGVTRDYNGFIVCMTSGGVFAIGKDAYWPTVKDVKLNVRLLGKGTVIEI